MNDIRWNRLQAKKLKILFVITEAGYFLSHRLALALSIQKAGFEVMLATTLKPSITLDTYGFRVIPLQSMDRTGLNPFRDIKLIHELWTIYKKENPDIIHHFALKPVLYGGIAAKLSRMPITINALTGLGFMFISSKWWVRCLRGIILHIFKWSWHLSKKGKRLTQLIVQNKDDYQAFVTIAPAGHILLIRGAGVNPTVFVPPASPPHNSPLKVVMVSRLLKDKGVLELIAANRLLHHEKLYIQLELYGAPDPLNPSSISTEDLLTWEAEGLCKWMGPTTDVAHVYQQADIAVLPSYREGLPKSLLEAAACGLPIITTDVPGCREIVQDQVNGLLVPAKNPEALAQALKTLLQDAKVRQAYGAAGRALVMAHFQDSIICKETLELYKGLYEQLAEEC